MRREDCEADCKGQGSPRPVAPVTYAAQDQEERHGQQRRNEELSVVPWRHQSGHVAAHHVGKAADKGAEESES